MSTIKTIWKYIIKMDLGEIGYGDKDLIVLALDRIQWRALVSTVMNLRVPYIVDKCLSGYVTGSFSRKAQLYEVRHLVSRPLQ
jgi:hypothetical protein